MKNLVAQFILRLQDRASSGLMRLQQRLGGIAQMARRIALVGGALAGLSVAGPVREAAALERTMRQTAITAGLSGEAVEQMMRGNLAMFQRVARETNIRVQELAAAAGTLVAGGGQAGEVWEQLVPIIGRVAVASGANAGDLAQSVLAMVNNLKIGPEQVEQALASMVQAGKEGQFELKDMAREFASLTAAAAGIGLTGPRAVHSLAAALQVARQGAGSAGEAATNLTNILQKMTSPDAIRNFRDMGVDLEAVLKNAGERGINPIEALIQKIREVTGGDMFRVGELFADSQVLGFLRPMLQQTEQYIAVRDRAAAADSSLIGRDQETAMRGLDAAMKRVTIGFDEFTTRLGTASEGSIRQAGDALFWLADRMKALDDAFPGLIDNGALLLGGLIALGGAIGVLGLVAGPIGAGLALVLSPVGAIIAAVGLLAAGAFLLYRNWDEVSAFFIGLWDDVQARFSEFASWLAAWVGGAVTGAVAGVRGAFDGLTSWFGDLWAGIRAPFDGFVGGIVSGIERVQALIQSVRERFSAGQAAEGAPPAMGNVQSRQAAAAASRGAGFYGPDVLAGASAANSNSPVSGEIVVRAAPGAEVVSAEGTNRNVPVTAAPPNRGGTRGRP